MLVRLTSFGILLAMSGLLLGATATPAHAYLDPGTGSMILQLLLGGIAGVAVAGRFYWHRLLVLLRIRSEKDPGGPSDHTTAPPSNRAD